MLCSLCYLMVLSPSSGHAVPIGPNNLYRYTLKPVLIEKPLRYDWPLLVFAPMPFVPSSMKYADDSGPLAFGIKNSKPKCP